jgi:hypothetical protein
MARLVVMRHRRRSWRSARMPPAAAPKILSTDFSPRISPADKRDPSEMDRANRTEATWLIWSPRRLKVAPIHRYR